MENINNTYGNENAMNADITSTPNVGTDTMDQQGNADRLSEVKTKAMDKATQVKERLAERASTLGSQVGQAVDSNRVKASQGLRSTSQRIDRLAMYLEEHDSKDMTDAMMRGMEESIRKNPARSVVIGLLVGIMLGRLFR